MAPDRKVTVGALAGACSAILVWASGEFGGVQIPGEIAASLTVLITFGVSYMVPNPTREP